MSRTRANAATLAVLVVGLVGAGRASAEPNAPVTVVVHLSDQDHVPARELAHAQTLVTETYARSGIRLVWTDGSAKLAVTDGNLHVDVFILNTDQIERTKPAAGVFGQASHITERAYIFYARLFQQAIRHGGEPARALALVMAHELGHVLLPEYSHTPTGLMRAHWEGRVTAIPDFLPAQAATMRAMLTPTN